MIVSSSAEDKPPQLRRRAEDIMESDSRLILYQLSELKSDVREGFAVMGADHAEFERRLAALELFRERREERDRAEAEAAANVNNRWIPISLGVLGFAVSILLALYAVSQSGT